jgi:hypothetical protein
VENMDLMGWFVGVIGVAVAVYYVWKGQKPVEEWETEFERALTDARHLVMGAQQMYVSGQLPEDERIIWAMERLQELRPFLSVELQRAAVESVLGKLKRRFEGE